MAMSESEGAAVGEGGRRKDAQEQDGENGSAKCGLSSSDKSGPGGSKGRKKKNAEAVDLNEKRARKDSEISIEKRIMSLADQYWPAGAEARFDSGIVSMVYNEYLQKPPTSSKRITSDPLLALEVSGYLERYLLPSLDPEASPWVHAMSVVVLANLKVREGVSAWAAFRPEPTKFSAFFSRVLELPSEKPEITFDERGQWTQFLIHAFQSLEDDMVSERIVGRVLCVC